MNSKKKLLVAGVTRSRSIKATLALLFWLVWVVCSIAQQAPPLFLSPPVGESRASQVDVAPGAPVEVLRSRAVSLSLEAWRSASGYATKRSASRQTMSSNAALTLNLFGDTNFRLYVESLTATSDGVGETACGRIGESGEGSAILTEYQGALSGSVRLKNGEFYEIFVPGSGTGEIRQVRFRGFAAADTDAVPTGDESAYGEDLPEASAREWKNSASAGQGPIRGADVDPPVADILVVYTEAARQARGDAAGMLAHINQVIAESNAAFESSAANLRYRLAGAVEVAFDDSISTLSYSSSLSALRSASDGHMDEVPALREQYSADMVSLWVSPPLPTSGTFTVGMAYLLGNNPEGFAGYAFSVVHERFAGGASATFAHETGHNMGLNHDPENGGSNGGLFADSVGYQQKELDPKFFTIMAYSAKCAGCQPLIQFSNPDVNFQTVPSGVAGKNDAVRTLNFVAPFAALWRGVTLPAPVCVYSVSPASLSIPAGGGSYAVNVSTTPGCSWAPVSKASWILASDNSTHSGSGTFNVNVASNATSTPRAGTLEVSGKTVSVSQAADAAPPSALLQISAKGLSFQAAAGDSTVTQVMRLRSVPSVANLSASAPNAPWLSASVSFANDTWQISVRANAQNLVEGTYEASLHFDCETAMCDPSSIPVRFTVRNFAATGPRIASGGVVNAASFQPGISSGAWISVFGTNLASTSRPWQTSDFQGSQMPLSLDGVQVLVDGRSAAVQFISPGQVNFQAPSNLATGWVTVEIRNSTGSDFAYVYSSRESPGFFTFDSEGHVAALHSDGTPVGNSGSGTSYPGRPATPGTVLEIYGTGFGPTAPDVPSGEVFSGAADLVSASSVMVTIGGKPAQIPFAGLTGAGLNQINAVVPVLAPGTYEIVADVAGSPTQFSGKLTVQ